VRYQVESKFVARFGKNGWARMNRVYTVVDTTTGAKLSKPGKPLAAYRLAMKLNKGGQL